jgi:hypothetical protein
LSKAKLAAAKELIQEKRYAEARALLKTVNDPIATRWLEQLDSIAPELASPSTQSNTVLPPSPSQYYASPPPINAEADRYYRRENSRANRRRIGSAFELLGIGIFCFAIFVYSAQPVPSIQQNGTMVVNIGLGWLFIPLGILAILGGLYRLLKRD